MQSDDSQSNSSCSERLGQCESNADAQNTSNAAPAMMTDVNMCSDDEPSAFLSSQGLDECNPNHEYTNPLGMQETGMSVSNDDCEGDQNRSNSTMAVESASDADLDNMRKIHDMLLLLTQGRRPEGSAEMRLPEISAHASEWVNEQIAQYSAVQESLARQEEESLAQIERAEAQIIRAWHLAQAQVDNEYNELMQKISDDAKNRLAIMEQRRVRTEQMQQELTTYGTLATHLVDNASPLEITRYGSALHERIERVCEESRRLTEERMPMQTLEFVPGDTDGLNFIGTLTVSDAE